MDHVILVDDQDRETGTMEKMAAHREGLLHRAFSVLLFNSKGEILLQKRAGSKYHSGGLWTNTCCSHPLPNEPILEGVRRKLKQEMGIDNRPEFAYKFIYHVALDHGLTEHEYDHVFIGTFDGEPEINEHEVEDWKFMDMAALRSDMQQNPDNYTHWFRLIVNHRELLEYAA